MKPIRIVLSPTRNRPLNMFLGLVLALVSLLVLLALATYSPADPSLNTATDQIPPQLDRPLRRMAQRFAVAVDRAYRFSSALVAGLVSAGRGCAHAPAARRCCAARARCSRSSFCPLSSALMPWHCRWLHAVPAEGVTGRLMAGLLVAYLNIQGAWLVAGA